MASVGARWDVSGERRKPKPSGSTSRVPSPNIDSPFLARFLSRARVSSCLPSRLALSISWATAISRSWLTCRVFSSDNCIWAFAEWTRFSDDPGKEIWKENALRSDCPEALGYRRRRQETTAPPFILRLRLKGSDVAVKKSSELRFGHHAKLARLHVTVLEQHQCRDGLDVVLPGKLLVLIHVDLGDFQLPSVVFGEIFEQGGERLARAAPFGPGVHQPRNVRFQDVGLEAVLGHMLNKIAHNSSLQQVGDVQRTLL